MFYHLQVSLPKCKLNSLEFSTVYVTHFNQAFGFRSSRVTTIDQHVENTVGYRGNWILFSFVNIEICSNTDVGQQKSL